MRSVKLSIHKSSFRTKIVQNSLSKLSVKCISETNSHYKYFKTASWMDIPGSSDYYTIVGNDINSENAFPMIEVKQPGMYIITSSVSDIGIDKLI